jgi:phospholipid/cholesterol/gamma-HCH transport system permease protein
MAAPLELPSFGFARGRAQLVLGGAWTLGHLADVAVRSEGLELDRRDYVVDASALQALDTAGALVILRALRATGRAFSEHRFEGMRPEHSDLLALVATSLAHEAPLHERHSRLSRVLERVGAVVAAMAHKARALAGFLGLTLSTLAATLLGRRKFRITSTVFHMEQTGLAAVPIVTLLSFLIGAVVAFLGATVLRDFGAQIYTVELVGY